MYHTKTNAKPVLTISDQIPIPPPSHYNHQTSSRLLLFLSVEKNGVSLELSVSIPAVPRILRTIIAYRGLIAGIEVVIIAMWNSRDVQIER
jgi:hypothetical protein